MTAAAQRETYGRGAYPLPVAAALAHLPSRTVRRWVEGYRYTHRGEQRQSEPITYMAAQPGETARGLLDFEQLLTLLLVKAFNDKGLGLPTIKRVAAVARETYGVPNPFVSQSFRTDGNTIFINLEAPGAERRMVDVLSGQQQFHTVVEASLFKDVVFLDDKAREWWPMGKVAHVVVAPDRQFGAPHIAGRGTRTDIIAQMVAAEGGGNQGEAAAADWYGLTPSEIAAAVRFEGEWLRPA